MIWLAKTPIHIRLWLEWVKRFPISTRFTRSEPDFLGILDARILLLIGVYPSMKNPSGHRIASLITNLGLKLGRGKVIEELDRFE